MFPLGTETRQVVHYDHFYSTMLGMLAHTVRQERKTMFQVEET